MQVTRKEEYFDGEWKVIKMQIHFSSMKDALLFINDYLTKKDTADLHLLRLKFPLEKIEMCVGSLSSSPHKIIVETSEIELNISPASTVRPQEKSVFILLVDKKFPFNGVNVREEDLNELMKLISRET